MFKLLLISKYLRRKLAPLFAAVAVMLCTAMVIIVMSVMGGFLEQFRESARNLTGDIVVEGPLQGFEGYEGLLERVVALPEIETGTPLIETFGLINFRDFTKPVQVQGVDMAALEDVVGYRQTLMWDPQDLLESPRDFLGEDHPRYRQLEAQLTRDHPIDPGPGGGLPEALIGIEVNPYQLRDDAGQYSIEGTWARGPVVLTVVPLSRGGTLDVLEQRRGEFIVVNEFKSGLSNIDAQYVFVPFDTLQGMLAMDERQVFSDDSIDPVTGEGGEEITLPARTNHLVLKAAPGTDVDTARAAVQDAIAAFYGDEFEFARPRALTWEQVHGQFLGAVENEKGLITFLFGIIGLVAVVMVATTFYMIVLEKTRDIGVLRAIGASRAGVFQMFLGYGLAIGVVGALLGLAIAVGVVTNLNEIQEGIYRATLWLSERSGAAEPTGWRMWDPQTYFFDRIPDRVDAAEAGWVVVGSVVSSVVGATLPAVIAARLRPVEALRYE